jgi:superfamily I DNA/RNA helicase/RecB family exonuclease
VSAPTNQTGLKPQDWPRAIGVTDGRQLIVGGPGTGKTEFLIRRILHLLTVTNVAPERILVLSFSRHGSADLMKRLRSQLDQSIGELDVTTFHSLAARIVERWPAAAGWEAPPVILTGPEQTAVIRSLLASEAASDWPVAVRGLLGSAAFAREVTDFVLRSSEQLLDVSDLEHMAASRPSWGPIPAFVRRYRDHLIASGKVDYSMVIAASVAALRSDPLEIPFVDYILVDEYQDTTRAQVGLLQALAGRTEHLTAVADPYQSIFSFRGATARNVTTFKEDFPGLTTEPGDDPSALIRETLTTSFRVSANVLAAAERVTAHEIEGIAGPVVPARAGGRVECLVFEQETQEAEWIASEIHRLHLEQNIPLSQIGVFVRSKQRFLQGFSRGLERRGIAHDVPDSRLIDQPAVRFVLDLMTAATDNTIEGHRSIRRVLLGPMIEAPIGLVREIERTSRNEQVPLSQVIAQMIPNGANLESLLTETAWATQMPAADGLWHVWSNLPSIQRLVEDPQRDAERAAWTSFSQVLNRWNERNPVASLREYANLVQEEDFEAQPLLSYQSQTEEKVVVTTLHQAKGLEFEVVFIADAVEGVFPDLRPRDSYLGVRHLLPHLPTETAEYRLFRLQEERRLAYTAMTRARSAVIWTATATGDVIGNGVPSRFLPLVVGSDSAIESVTLERTNRLPLTANEAEAWLRRKGADPTIPEPERRAALMLLADGSDWNLRPIEEFAGMRERGPDTGVIPPPIRLSPSQGEAYAQCPRRYALERRLHIGDSSSTYASFGTMVHAILEHVERVAWDEHGRVSTATEALERLDEVFDPSEFGGDPFARSWHNRALDTISRVYEWDMLRHEPVALEENVAMEIDGVRWRGIVDRIDQLDTGLRIVDYKTSTTAARHEDAAASLQLGFYYLAAREHDRLASLGQPVAGEFWYPSKSLKTKFVRRAFDPSRADDVETEIRRITAGVIAEQFPPTPGSACESCSVRLVCPEFPEGMETFA